MAGCYGSRVGRRRVYPGMVERRGVQQEYIHPGYIQRYTASQGPLRQPPRDLSDSLPGPSDSLPGPLRTACQDPLELPARPQPDLVARPQPDLVARPQPDLENCSPPRELLPASRTALLLEQKRHFEQKNTLSKEFLG